MDVLDGHRSDGSFIDHHSQEENKCETSITSSNLLHTPGHSDCSHEQSSGVSQRHERSSEQDSPLTGTNSQYASRAHQAGNNSDTTLDQQQNQYGQNEYEFITSNDSGNHCEQTSLFEARMANQDDAFVPFCAEAISDNDPHRTYYTNKLYEPLKSGANNSQVQQNQLNHHNNHNHHQHSDNEPFHIDEQDDELSLLAQLDFLESSTQNLCAGRRRTNFNKILEDDEDDCNGGVGDDDETNLGKDDALDALQLTSLIDSFVDFVPSPLIDTRTADDQLSLPLCGSHVSTNTEELPDSSQRGNERSSPMEDQDLNHEIGYVSADSYNQSQTDQYLISKNNQHQQIFSDPNYPLQSSTCYSANDVHSTIRDHHQPIFDSRIQSEQCQSIVSELESIQDVPDQNQTDRNNKVSSSDCLQLVQSTNYESGTTSLTRVDSSEKKRSLEEEPQQQMRRSKLKKRRPALSSPEKKNKNSQQVNLIEATNDETETSSAQIEHINGLTNCFMNDEDESLVSDNNSLRSDSCRRNPIVNHYRRRTANARERIRMREINQAFEKLKKVVPIELVEQAALESGEMSDQASARGGRRKSSPSSGASHQGESLKLTKITTLRMAVSYIAKLTEILNQNPEPPSTSSSIVMFEGELKRASKSSSNNTKTNNGSKETTSSKATSRRSRSKSKKSSQVTAKMSPTKADQKQLSPTSSPVAEDGAKMERIESDGGVQGIKSDQIISQDIPQNRLVVNNSIFSRAMDQQQQQPPQQQTTFISIPNHQKQQYLAAYSNQQQLLISQPIGTGHERLVTPVAVAILGIPTTNSTNTQPTASPNDLIGPQNIQLVGLQKTPSQAVISDGHQQHRAYNLQIAQAQQQQPHTTQQNRQPQQVTFTLDEMSGMPVLRLANPQVQNQSMPIQFRTISNQSHQIIHQNQQQSQIFTTQNGVNYALRPILSQLTNGSATSVNSPSESPMPTNFQLSTIRICNNNNQTDNLISQNSNNLINNDNNNSNNHLIRNNYSVLRPTPVDSNDQSQMCNINQHIGSISAQQQFNGATFTTGMSSDQLGNMTPVSANGSNAITQQHFENQTNHQIQLTSQQTVNNLQQSNCLTPKTMFVPASNIMTLTNGSRVLHTRPISLQAQSPFGGEFQIGQNKTANLVYINTLPQANGQPVPQQVQQQQQQVCILTDQSQEPQKESAIKHVQVLNEQQEQQSNQNNSAVGRGETTVRAIARDRMSYVTHFSAQQSDQSQVKAANEANITQLVASLATSIQPVKCSTQMPVVSTNADANREGSQQSQLNQQQQQQPVRTYRFHNYDGNMINNHLYGNTNHNQQLQQQQQQSSSKRAHANKAAELQQVSPKQRSRQNSLSSICSTTSCSSSSLNYTSSTSGSPSNSAPVVSIMVGSSPGGHRSMTSSTSPIMIEDGLLNSTSMPRSARIAT